MFKWFTGLGIISVSDLRDWIVDSIYRIDVGLYEYEREYQKKFKRKATYYKKVNADKGYNQLQGKFTILLSLAQDFHIPLPETGDRIRQRVLARGGYIRINNGRSIIKITNKPNRKTRRVPPSKR